MSLRTLRAEVARPLRGLHPRYAAAGSAVLLRLLGRLLVRGWRAAQRPAPTPESEPDAESGPKAGPPSAADRAEHLALAALSAGAGLAVLASAAGAVVGILGPFADAAPGIGLIAWYVAAAMAAPQPTAPKNTAPAADSVLELGPEAQQRAADLQLLHLVLAAVQRAVDSGRRGVHLAALLADVPDVEDVAALRRHCQRLDVPVRKLNIRGQGVTWGIHIEDVERVLGCPLREALATPADTPAPTPAGGPPRPPSPTPTAGPEPAPAEPARAGNFQAAAPLPRNPPQEPSTSLVDGS